MVFAPNHLPLIRSFLIDSGLATPLCEACCAKKFLLCTRARRTRIRARDERKSQKNSAKNVFANASFARKKSLFHRNFFDSAIMCAMSRDA